MRLRPSRAPAGYADGATGEDCRSEKLPVEDRCLWWTAALAGLRRGELRGLRWSDIDLDENVIAVERSWDEKEGAVAPKSTQRQTPRADPGLATSAPARAQGADGPQG